MVSKITAKKKKVDKMNIIKIKNTLQKTPLRKLRQATNWGKRFAENISD